MKTTNILYWTFTGIICALMLFSGIGGLFTTQAGVEMFKQLGYPLYFGKLLAIAKILGVIALLTPGFAKLKEWAYAGFTFDMIFAIYSFICIGSSPANYAPIFVFIAILVLSYVYHHKRLKVA